MKVLGLILELNPFHNGHKYFIDEAIKQDNYDYVVAVVSSSFCMRGDISIIDKFTKTKLCLDNNIDLVLELPFMSAINSADYFGYNAYKILNDIGITDLCFGSENGSLEELLELDELTTSSTFEEHLKVNIDKGLSYGASATLAIKEITQDEAKAISYSLPNNTLALSYIKAWKQINSNIKLHTIKRISNNYYDCETNNTSIASATSLRCEISKGNNISKYIPNYEYAFSNENIINDKIFNLLKYLFINKNLEEIKNTYLVSEGIENRIISMLDKSSNYDDLVKNVCTKRYNETRIKRLFLHLLLSTPKDFENKYNSYLRVLGMSNKGRKYLSNVNKSSLITNIKNSNNELLLIELKATKLYDLLTDKNIYLEEFKTPIKK